MYNNVTCFLSTNISETNIRFMSTSATVFIADRICIQPAANQIEASG